MPDANQIIDQADSQRDSVYDSAEAAAQAFVDDAGTLHPLPDAVDVVLSNTRVEDVRLARRIISHLVEDVADPVTAVRTDEGTYVGVISFTAQDFYYEADEFHDQIGRVTRGVCSACVEEHSFDHQAVQNPSVHQYNKQAQVDVAQGGLGSMSQSPSASERRNVLGAHFLEDHADVAAYEVAGAAPASKRDVLRGLGNGTDVPDKAEVTQNHSPGDVLRQTGVEFDHVKRSFDLGIDSITVGATLVSGTTIGGNTALHGGNLGNFNVEDFGTTSTTSGEVPTSQGDGTLAMQDPGGGGGLWTEDANSPLTASSTSEATITLDGQYSLVKAFIVGDSSSTTGNAIQMRVNGNTNTYETTMTDGSPFSDGFVRQIAWSGAAEGSVCTMAGEWSGDWGGGCEAPTLHSTYGHTADAYGHPGVTSPLDSITLYNNAANNFSVTARVYGWSG